MSVTIPSLFFKSSAPFSTVCWAGPGTGPCTILNASATPFRTRPPLTPKAPASVHFNDK